MDKRKLHVVLNVLLAAVFLGSVGRIAWQLMQYKEGGEVYAEAAELVELPNFSDVELPLLPDAPDLPAPAGTDPAPPARADPYADALRNMDFSALQQVNSDVFGWILIPNTNISYPLVQGTDNDYYLDHTWKRTRNSVGAIFLDQANRNDLSDFNTILYGHRMNDRSMFGELRNYQTWDDWSQRPYVYLTDASGSHRYDIFAAYEVSVEMSAYQTSFPDERAKQTFLDSCMEQSVFDTGIVPTIYDHVLTLSTCTGSGHATRWVVQAVRRGESDVSEPPPDIPADS